MPTEIRMHPIVPIEDYVIQKSTYFISLYKNMVLLPKKKKISGWIKRNLNIENQRLQIIVYI
jgi:hypothetical protein